MAKDKTLEEELEEEDGKEETSESEEDKEEGDSEKNEKKKMDISLDVGKNPKVLEEETKLNRGIRETSNIQFVPENKDEEDVSPMLEEGEERPGQRLNARFFGQVRDEIIQDENDSEGGFNYQTNVSQRPEESQYQTNNEEPVHTMKPRRIEVERYNPRQATFKERQMGRTTVNLNDFSESRGQIQDTKKYDNPQEAMRNVTQIDTSSLGKEKDKIKEINYEPGKY